MLMARRLGERTSLQTIVSRTPTRIQGAGHGRSDLTNSRGRANNSLSASEDMVKSVFSEMDEDGDGKIQQEDVAALIQLLLPDISLTRLYDVFAIADADGDGYLNYEEFLAFVFLGNDSCDDEELVPLAGSDFVKAEICTKECTDTRSIEQVLTMPKEPSCPGTLLVSAAVPLGDRITMLGGMLAHPCVGVYPYRDGPAQTIVAAELSKGTGGHLPAPLRRALTRSGIDEAFDLFFVVSDLSKPCFASATAFNIMYHPWCFPKVKSGQSLGGSGWMVGLHVPPGGGVCPTEAGLTSRRSPPSRMAIATRTRDADPRDAAVDCLEKASVFIHPGAGGALCCSPNNVRIGLRRSLAPPVVVVWSACVREPGKGKSRRACICVHWLVADATAARRLEAAATEARTLEEFLAVAAAQLGADTAPMVAATLACQTARS